MTGKSTDTLVLFTTRFPHAGPGYEVFLETEIHYLAEAFPRVVIHPMSDTGAVYSGLPGNVTVSQLTFSSQVSLKKVLKTGWMVLLKWFVSELIKSPHRLKYLSKFKWNFYRLAGLWNDALQLKTILDQYPIKRSAFYTYWFDDWATRLILCKAAGWKGSFTTRIHLFDFEEEFQERGYLPFRYTEMNLADRVAPISEYARNYVIQRFGARRTTTVKRLGINKCNLNPGAPSGSLNLVSCSSLSWYKRPLLLMEFFRHFPVPVNWYHFGSGPMEAEFLAQAAILPEHVNFVYKGHVNNRDIYAFYAETGVDAFINLSSFEGIPVSMMEAAAHGIPLIGCDLCGIPEIVTTATGLLLPADPEPAAAARQVSDWVSTHGRDPQFRAGVVAFWQSHYAADRNYPEFISSTLLNP